MWIGRFASTANRWWNYELHVPLPWKGLPTFDIGLHHVDDATKARVRLAFPDGDLILKGVYYTTRDAR